MNYRFGPHTQVHRHPKNLTSGTLWRTRPNKALSRRRNRYTKLPTKDVKISPPQRECTLLNTSPRDSNLLRGGFQLSQPLPSVLEGTWTLEGHREKWTIESACCRWSVSASVFYSFGCNIRIGIDWSFCSRVGVGYLFCGKKWSTLKLVFVSLKCFVCKMWKNLVFI